MNGSRIAAGSNSHFLYRKNSSVLIRQIINHPEFESSGLGLAKNDISLVKFETPLRIENYTIKAACLFRSEEESTKPFEDLVLSAFRFKNVADYWRLLKSNFADRSFDSLFYVNEIELIKAKGLNHSYCLGMLIVNNWEENFFF